MVEKSCQSRTRIYQLRMRIYQLRTRIHIFCYDAVEKEGQILCAHLDPFAGPVTLYLILEHRIHTIL